ncbi:MAG: ribosome biogenesis GTPase Der [Alphaproteobacteria bacterium]|jgi:GTP-binding protein
MFTVVIVGRPNVGKSTLFNRLSVSSKAIVHDLPGVTRDVKETIGVLGELTFKLFDTAGLDFHTKKSQLLIKTISHTELAISNADIVLFVVDGKGGIVNEDKVYADWLRKKNLPVILLINKCDNKIAQHNISEFYKIGFKNVASISAEHNKGMGDLHVLLAESLRSEQAEIPEEVSEDVIKIAIVGRPNVGKSTFINRLLKQERLLTGPEPGLTRDSISLDWKYKNHNLQLVDTAGIRKKSNIYQFLEKLSTGQSIQSIKMADVVILMVDVTMPLEKQDLTIANLAYEEGKPVVLVVNKADLIKDKQVETEEIIFKAQQLLNNLGSARISFVSALYKTHLDQVMDVCVELYEKWQMQIPTSKLNKWLEVAVSKHALPLLEAGRKVRIKFANQIRSKPPTFQLFTNRPDKITKSYSRYLHHSICEYFGLDGVPIRFKLKKIHNPYTDRD